MTESERDRHFPNRHKAVTIFEKWKGKKRSQVRYEGIVYQQQLEHPVIVGDSCWLNLVGYVPGGLVELKRCELV